MLTLPEFPQFPQLPRVGWLVTAIGMPVAYFPRYHGTTTDTTNWINVARFMYEYRNANGIYAHAQLTTMRKDNHAQ